MMNSETLTQHIGILGWLNVACGALFAVIGIFAFVFLTGIGIMAGDPEAIPILGFVGGMGAGFMIMLAIACVFTFLAPGWASGGSS